MGSEKKPEHGLLIDYAYCTGCHACEVACAQELRRPAGIVKGVATWTNLTDNLPDLPEWGRFEASPHRATPPERRM